ncbi:MAG: ATP-binding cassette domain-containing protein, partial [Clostridia bacterium]|nr:ATP-binding cassette domain-containing protein [Clostridia bacterium]
EDLHGAKVIETVKGDIELRNVSFSYGGKDKREILDNVSLKINAGEKVALVGPSGGGKTTICNLIPKFYRLDENGGSILIDGEDIENINTESLRKQIGIVQQDVFLFSGSIKENIRYGCQSADDEQVRQAAIKANIDDFVSTLPNGYDTEIGERGVRLSGGQKQRISIARAFLKNPSILILDEATSALDSNTEVFIQQALDRLCEGRTCIVVAHRLSTVRNADKIAVIDGGRVEETGTHNELMEAGGIYKNLYELQYSMQ